MENPLTHFPQPSLVDQPQAPVGPPASSLVVSSAFPFDHPSTSKPPGPFMYKNRLQEFTQRSSLQLPVYRTFNDGPMHAPKFRSTVLVDGLTYTSESTFSNIKAAEQDVAKHALECISKKLKDEGCSLAHDIMFCKSILNESVVKTKLQLPTYSTIQSEGLPPIFVSTLFFNGMMYKGETGRTKKEAEQLVARAVIQSLLDDDRYVIVVSEIIRSKAKLQNALNKVKDSNIANFNTTPVVANIESHNIEEVETTVIPNCVLTSESVQPSSGSKHPRHEFKNPTVGQGSDCIHLPIAFVPAFLGQTADGEHSRKSKKKKRAKLNADSQLAVAGVPFAQTTPPCSLAP
ncbi:putative Rhd six-like 1 [Hibiscus syriacus]|uniref:Rhd six-like 1 n=1 Tax=Hibiscus syriacus TaxID=106335 RepID=A0A6A2X7D5_HIBSY|nr:double-stranded RNA-binding protein 4-like isoform X2 [Hibiscus syriacus]KAE8671082.1 putative Rhd six-like 1 [Hibiscus syriacus]